MAAGENTSGVVRTMDDDDDDVTGTIENMTYEEKELKFGDIISSTYVSYYKFTFVVQLKTTKYVMRVHCGGTADSIYEFSPTDPSWESVYFVEWVAGEWVNENFVDE